VVGKGLRLRAGVRGVPGAIPLPLLDSKALVAPLKKKKKKNHPCCFHPKILQYKAKTILINI